MRTGSGLRTTD